MEMGHLRMVQREARNCVGDAFDGMMEEILQLVKCGIEKVILIVVISSSFAMLIDQNSMYTIVLVVLVCYRWMEHRCADM